MNNRIQLKFVEVQKMVLTLNKAIDLVAENKEEKYDLWLKDSVIQRFEYSIEWIWKLLKYILLEDFWKDIPAPKQIIKEAYNVGLIKKMKVFINMIDRRNRLAHDYHENFAQYSFEEIAYNYIKPINTLLEKLQKEYE